MEMEMVVINVKVFVDNAIVIIGLFVLNANRTMFCIKTNVTRDVH